MIKEIENPAETIYEFLAKKSAEKKIKKLYKTKMLQSDVIIKEDTPLITELSAKCAISYDLAEKIASVFFEEIKKSMLDGDVVCLGGLGKFYISAPHFDQFANVVILKEKKAKLNPKFKVSPDFKALLKLAKKSNNS